MSTKFEKIGHQKYAVAVVNGRGKAYRVIVKATEVGNPSARGGAYMTEWHAYNGGLYVSAKADTRQAAFDKAMVALAARGFSEAQA